MNEEYVKIKVSTIKEWYERAMKLAKEIDEFLEEQKQRQENLYRFEKESK